MPGYAKRVDANHNEIKDCYERLGVAVVDLSRAPQLIGGGVLDLLCSIHGLTWLSETKTEKGELNPAQWHFMSWWKGDVEVVKTPEDVAMVVKRKKAKAFGKPARA